jgi:bacillolysin
VAGAQYNGKLSTTDNNPLAGRRAFTGRSFGYTASRLNLSPLAGRNVRFRFRIGTDPAVGAQGWSIDDIRIYRCTGN